jgi:aminoglycoside 3-N-acetyltransferase
MSTISTSSLTTDLAAIGVRAGDRVMVHASYKSLKVTDPEVIIQALLAALGPRGTLLMPALSYLQQPRLVHDTRSTPACVGFLPEYFRTRPGTRRSLHPTHSVCAIGADVGDWLDDHVHDTTPCGEQSPFHKLLERGGKILMLGCGLKPNTTMHAIEEYVTPPYLFRDPVVYTITDAGGRTFEKQYTPHNFAGVAQRYDRVAGILHGDDLISGTVGQAHCHLLNAAALLTSALACLRQDAYYFVDSQSPPILSAR